MNLASTSAPTVHTNPQLQPADVKPLKRARRASPGPTAFLSREQILAATRACFHESGYDGTTIRAIASRLSCSVGSIYRYFTDKRDLLIACAGAVFEPVIEELEQRRVSSAKSVQTYVERAGADIELYRLMFWLDEGEHGVPASVDRIIDLWAPYFGGREPAETLWATVHGMVLLEQAPEVIVSAIHGRILAVARQAELDETQMRAIPFDATPEEALRAVNANGEDVTLL